MSPAVSRSSAAQSTPGSATRAHEHKPDLTPATALVSTQLPSVAPTPATPDVELDAAFARFLRLDVANGDASIDTLRGYRSQLAAWVVWCTDHTVEARTYTPEFDLLDCRSYASCR